MLNWLTIGDSRPGRRCVPRFGYVNLGDIHDAEDMTGRAGLNEQAQVEGAIRADRAGMEDVGRYGTVIIIAGQLRRAGILDFKVGFHVFDQSPLMA